MIRSSDSAASTMDRAEPKGQSRAERNWFWIRLPTRADLAPPYHVGDDEHAQGGDEDQDGACGHAGHGQGQGNLPESGERSGSQIGSGFQQPTIQLFDGNVDGQDHKGQQGINHAQHDRSFII